MTKVGKGRQKPSEQANSKPPVLITDFGQVSSRLDTLARAISRPESSGQLLAAAESVMQSGHTSGIEAVMGLLLGLAAWEWETILAFG
jgi:hypothetical protein